MREGRVGRRGEMAAGPPARTESESAVRRRASPDSESRRAAAARYGAVPGHSVSLPARVASAVAGPPRPRRRIRRLCSSYRSGFVTQAPLG